MDIMTVTLSQFIKHCEYIAKKNLVQCSSGNFSQKISPTTYLITPSGSWMEDIEGVCECDINNNGNVIRSPKDCKPSSENCIHQNIFYHRKDVKCILHFQSPYATSICCADDSRYDKSEFWNFNIIPEVPYYIKSIGFVQYVNPGTSEFSSLVVSEFKSGNNLVVCKNHGIFVVANSFVELMQRALFFELVCKIKINNKDCTYIPEYLYSQML